MNKYLAILLLINSANTLAAGGSGSPMDLIWPAINFVALFVFLIVKLRKPLSETFNRQASEVQSTYELAEKKDKEAQIKLETYQKKMSGVERERERVITEANQESEKLISDIENETIETIQKLKIDAQSKVEHEVDQLTKQLNESLVDEVIKKTREKIGSNANSQTKATQNLVQSIGR